MSSAANPTILTGPSTTTEFQPSLALQAPKPTTRSVTSHLPGAVSNASEARYWAEKFGLGSYTDTSRHNSAARTRIYAQPRKLVLNASSAAVIHQVVFGPPTFSKACPLAVVGGPRVQLYGTSLQSTFHRSLNKPSSSTAESSPNTESNTITADRQIQTGGSLALAAVFRHDGRLLATATEHGQIRVADVTTRAILCTFSVPNKLPIRSIAWLRDGQHVLSGGDDGMVRIWSLTQGALPSESSSGRTLSGHGDTVRSTAIWQASTREKGKWPHDSLAFSGSYDGTIRVWNLGNLESQGEDLCLAVLSHGDPVEALLVMPSTGNATTPCWLISVGGTKIKVWNPVTGFCVCELEAKHRKTITSVLAMPRKNPEAQVKVQMRIFTAGLDGLLRVHTWDSNNGMLRHLHGIPVGVSITALATNDTANRIAIGTVEGTVWVRQRGSTLTDRKRTRDPPAGTYAFFQRGMNANPASGDFVVQEVAGKKRKLRKFDLALKQFRYGDALDEALETRKPQVVVGVLEELGKRRGLTIALSNRDEESLEPILAFTARYIARPRFAAILIGVASLLLDIYGEVGQQSEIIDELFAKLQQQVTIECKDQQSLLGIQGQIDAILAAEEDDEYADSSF